MQKTTTQSLAIATAGTQQARSASASESTVAAHPATHEAIAARAFEIYLDSGMQQGHCKRNWAQAEHDLQACGKTA